MGLIMLTYAFIHHPYLVCIHFGMPSLHFNVFIFLFLYFFDVNLMLISATARAKKSILSSVQVTTTPELETALTYNCQLEPDEGPTTLHTSKLIFWFLSHAWQQATDYPSFTRGASSYSKQLNAALYLGGVHSISFVSHMLRWSTAISRVH